MSNVRWSEWKGEGEVIAVSPEDVREHDLEVDVDGKVYSKFLTDSEKSPYGDWFSAKIVSYPSMSIDTQQWRCDSLKMVLVYRAFRPAALTEWRPM